MRCWAAIAVAVLLLAIYPVDGMAQTLEDTRASSGRRDVLVTTPATEQVKTLEGKAAFTATYTDRGASLLTLVLEEGTTAQWTFYAEKAGDYTLSLRYLPLDGSANVLETSVLVNDSYGSGSGSTIQLKRVWKNAGAPSIDAHGNQTRARQVEAGVFNTYTVREKLENDAVVYALKAGENTIRMSMKREKAAVAALLFTPVNSTPEYAAYQKAYASVAVQHDGHTIIDAEKASLKSDATLYSLADRSSPSNSPIHYSRTLLNTIGGNNWRYTQQWLEWDFEVGTTGLYQISMRLKQNHKQGQNANRRVYIDGEVPFQELNSVAIPYKGSWQYYTLGGDTPYQIYLTAGKHTIRLENTIGNIGNILKQTSELVQQLNQVYRNILVYIGNTPDADRDYQLDILLPDLASTLQTLLIKQDAIKRDLFANTGDKGRDYAQFEDLERQISLFLKNYSKIPVQFEMFRTNISALSEWLLSAQEQPVTLDYFEISAPGRLHEKEESGFFSRLWFDIKSFFASFFVDYSVISSTEEAEKSITVWIGATTTNAAGSVASGRDQASALKSVIDTYFTPQYNVSVNLKLVDINSLIPAVATGNGPDMTLFLPSKSIMDYGFRGALYDLATFDDYKQTTEMVFPESIVPFTYGKSAYALPDSYAFNLLFYRRDILEELHLNVPETWDDVYKILPELNNNYLSFGLPSLAADSIEVFTTMLYQHGGTAYDAAGKQALFSSELGIQAFEQWGDFYTKYNVPQKLDLLTYFRTGQTPLIVVPYTFYNNLAAGAPEIDGLWGAALVPGTKGTDGQVNHTVTGLSTGSVIFQNARQPEAAWAFLKWWISEDAQYRYGTEVETTLGAAGRIATANRTAFRKLPWSKEAAAVIGLQMETSRGLPEVPGGYMSLRYIPTAMRLVVNNGIYPRDALISYTKLINEEIATKRQEFHLE